jgi:7-keto-8-aminopelargonate synthetase-like enzyme
MHAAERLLHSGYYAPPIPIMAVPKNKPRIRFFISARHTQADITGALDEVAAAMPEAHRGEAARAGAGSGLRLGT